LLCIRCHVFSCGGDYRDQDVKFQLEGQESKRNLTGNDSDDGTAMRDGIVAQMTGYGAKCR